MHLSHEEIVRGLSGYAYPVPEVVGGDGRRFVRRWVVRSARILPGQEQLDALALRIETRVMSTLKSAYSEQTSSKKLLDSAAGVRLVGIDEHHCIVAIELPSPSEAVGDAAGIGTWSSLRAVDEAFVIEDLEGLPKKMWFQLA